MKNFLHFLNEMEVCVKVIFNAEDVATIYCEDNFELLERAQKTIVEEWGSFWKFGSQFGIPQGNCCSDYIFDTNSSKVRGESHNYMFSNETHFSTNGKSFYIRMISYMFCTMIKKAIELYSLGRYCG